MDMRTMRIVLTVVLALHAVGLLLLALRHL